MNTKAGDRIIVSAAKIGGVARQGEILEAIEGELRVSYRVRWADGHESLFTPGPGAAAVVPGSKSTAKKSTVKKSTVKKSTVKKSTVKKKRG